MTSLPILALLMLLPTIGVRAEEAKKAERLDGCSSQANRILRWGFVWTVATAVAVVFK